MAASVVGVLYPIPKENTKKQPNGLFSYPSWSGKIDTAQVVFGRSRFALGLPT